MPYLLFLFLFFLSLASAGDPPTPPECSFERSFFKFRYLQATDIEGTACLGWDPTLLCPRQPHDFEDLKEVVRIQATKDGQFETTTVGRFTAGFFLFTTAFANRDTSLFDIGLTFHFDETTFLTWYWSRDGDFMTISAQCWSGFDIAVKERERDMWRNCRDKFLSALGRLVLSDSDFHMKGEVLDLVSLLLFEFGALPSRLESLNSELFELRCQARNVRWIESPRRLNPNEEKAPYPLWESPRRWIIPIPIFVLHSSCLKTPLSLPSFLQVQARPLPLFVSHPLTSHHVTSPWLGTGMYGPRSLAV